MQTNTLIGIIIAVVLCIIGAFFKCTADFNANVKIEQQNKTIGTIYLCLGILVGIIWPGGMICCSIFGTETLNIDTVSIYEIDGDYVTYSDKTHTPHVYVKEGDQYVQIELPNAVIHESETDENYYTALKTTKSWLFYDIETSEYEIYLDIR